MDVWLIYKCENCNITYNLTILSRINPNTVNHELFRRFNDNDESLAWQYAFDMEILRKNRVEADFSNIEYNIVKQNEPLFDMINISSDSIEFEIKTSYCLTLKLTYVVRTCLEISNSQLESMLSAGILSLQPIRTTLKHKVKNGLKVIVNCEKLERFLKETSKK